MLFHHAVPLGTEMNVEFIVQFQDQPRRVRVKAKVDYCLLRTKGDGADLDLVLTQIGSNDKDLLSSILQALSESKQFNLRS